MFHGLLKKNYISLPSLFKIFGIINLWKGVIKKKYIFPKILLILTIVLKDILVIPSSSVIKIEKRKSKCLSVNSVIKCFFSL